MSVVVFTSNAYVDLLDGFAHFFNKYWGSHQDVNVIGFKPPKQKMPANFNFISAGKQEDYPAKDFCGPFRPVVESLDTKTITYFLDDTYIISKVNIDLHEEIKELISNGVAQKAELFWGGKPQYETTRPWPQNTKFREYAQNTRYRCNLSPGIIEKDYFLSFFENGYSPWDFELKNWNKSQNDGATILIGEKPIAPWFNLIKEGRLSNSFSDADRTKQVKFGWNKYQKIACEDVDYMLKYKNWKPNL